MTPIPDDIVSEIYEASNERRSLRKWPEYEDRDAGMWAATPYRHAGDTVMYPYAGDLEPMLRAEVEAEYGPLTEVAR